MIPENYLLIVDQRSSSITEYFSSESIVQVNQSEKQLDDDFIFECSNAIQEKIVEDHITNPRLIIPLEFHKNTATWNSAIHLATMLRLEEITFPIFVIGEKSIFSGEKLRIPTFYYSLLELKTCKYLTKEEAFSEINSEDGKTHYKIEKYPSSSSFGLDEFLQSVEIPAPKDRHQATNEWGALKLALNAGYSIEDIGYNFPNTLYFKGLHKKTSKAPHDNRIRFDKDFGKLKILLIDDNANKGWKAVFQKIFRGSAVDALLGYDEVTKVSDYQSYDLVFLDLYMPGIRTKDINKKDSLSLLAQLKVKFPEVPIIIFTASNKSWTLNEVIKNGADGMYVKESPEYAEDRTYSKENFENFNRTIHDVSLKYKVLRPFWTAIQDVLNSDAFQGISEKTRQQGSSKFKGRIEERLLMFYGLLKRGFEQTDYNKSQFHFSDYELAFMTLWSTLNEISEAYYTKTQPRISLEDKGGKEIVKHPCGQIIKYLNTPYRKKYRWEIVGQPDDVFVEYHYGMRYDQFGKPQTHNNKRFFKMDSKQLSSFKFQHGKFSFDKNKAKTETNYENTLYLQIAFLIEMMDNLRKSDNVKEYQRNLVRLNDLRNHLYLTHGNDMSSGFYDQLEVEKRKTTSAISPEKEIRLLFELVGFLLTGEENELSF